MSKPTSVDNLFDPVQTDELEIPKWWIDKQKAKINRLIVLAKLEGFDIAFDCHDYDRLRAYKEQLTTELGDSEAEKNSGTWSRV